MRLTPYRKMQNPAGLWPEASLFDNFFRDFLGNSTPFGRDSVVPAVDILEKDGNIVLRAELPGLDEKEIELKLDGNVLTMSGERKFSDQEKRENYHRIERRFGCFSRSFTLPESADSDKIKAEYKSGVLTVTIPQRPEAKKTREIPVSVQ